MSVKNIVSVVTEDSTLSTTLKGLCKSAGLTLVTHASVFELIEAQDKDKPVTCVIAHLSTGIEVLKDLAEYQCVVPVVLIAAPGMLPITVQAMKLGAFDIVEKTEGAVEAAKRATSFFLRTQKLLEEKRIAAKRVDSLTKRELQVLNLMVEGLPNRKIAERLGISPKTLDIHRANLMEKMEARTTADMCRAHLVHVTNPVHLPLLAKAMNTE